MESLRIGILVRGQQEDPFTEDYKNYAESGTEYTDDDLLLVNELESRGHITQAIVWNDQSIDWDSYQVVLVRSPWGFFFQLDTFNSWLERVKASKARVFNSPAHLAKNISKKYLKELQEAGIQTVPTEIINKGQSVSLSEITSARGWEELVIKPASLGGAISVERAKSSAANTLNNTANKILQNDDLIVQEFFPEISEGEWSLVFFGENYSHAVKKIPASGQWKEQVQYGGSQIAAKPSDKIIAQASAARKVFAEGTLYSRVDGLERNGSLFINELELIDPRLFFASDKNAAKRFVDEMEKLIANS